MTSADPTRASATAQAAKKLNPFERYLSIWVALCMAAGVSTGNLFPAFVGKLRGMEFGSEARLTCLSRF
jgi:arsenite transporter